LTQDQELEQGDDDDDGRQITTCTEKSDAQGFHQVLYRSGVHGLLSRLGVVDWSIQRRLRYERIGSACLSSNNLKQ
jgi:hypothetical protein